MSKRKSETDEEYRARMREYMRGRYEQNKERVNAYREANKERIKKQKSEYMKRYYEENKAEIAEKRKEYAQTNKERIAEYQRKYRQEHKEEIAEKKREYRAEHIDEIRIKKQQYRQANKEYIDAKNKEYYLANHERLLEYAREYNKKWHAEHREDVSQRKHNNRIVDGDRIRKRERELRSIKAEQKRREYEEECARLGIEVDRRYKKLTHPFCSEPINQIEGYDQMMANPTVQYVIHHRRETHTEEGVPLGYGCHLSASMLKTQGLYYKRPARELVFMPTNEHTRLHHSKSNL